MVGEKKVRQMLDPRTNLEDPWGTENEWNMID